MWWPRVISSADLKGVFGSRKIIKRFLKGWEKILKTGIFFPRGGMFVTKEMTFLTA